MILATKRDEQAIIDYLQMDVVNCIYLYMDIVSYGISSGEIEVWFSKKNDKIDMVVMKYHDSLQVYAKTDTTSVKELIEKIIDVDVTMISAPKYIVEIIEHELTDYKVTYGVIYRIDDCRLMKDMGIVYEATEDDVGEIASLICSDDEIGGHYNPKDLEKQLRCRIQSGTGRSFIIKRDGKIVAHSATYAETKDLAVVGGTIIREDCRDLGYYMIISNYISHKLKEEGKIIYTFSISKKMISYHSRAHVKCAEYGKLERKEGMV